MSGGIWAAHVQWHRRREPLSPELGPPDESFREESSHGYSL